MRGTNTTTSLKTGHGPSQSLRLVRCEDLAAAERLPQGLRRMLWETNIKLSAVTVLAYLHSVERQIGDPWEAERATARKLVALQEQEIAAFAEEYGARYRQRLPHVAAAARCVRYGKLGEVPPRRRRRMGRVIREGTASA